MIFQRTWVPVVLVLSTCSAFPFFRELIPNADNVPHPCKANHRWRGVGHLAAVGAGPRNKFGNDFFKAGKKWTVELCQMDSDGDSLTNGEELGDPNCVWKEGDLPEKNTGITHPGVCGPWGDPKCEAANRQVSCESGDFECPSINNVDVMDVTLRFPSTPVPVKPYTYICMAFSLDFLEENTEYHIIAAQPFVNNSNVLSNFLLNGCGGTGTNVAEPHECNMAGAGCQQYLSIWGLGMTGECLPSNAGIKLSRAKTGFLTLQLHWMNPMLRTGYVDSSGVTLYLTKTLRSNSAGYWLTGQIHLNIPPKTDRYLAHSTCSENCTRKIVTTPVNIIKAWNHMHYLGIAGKVQHYRNGKRIGDITNDDHYSYDNPHIYEFKSPYKLLPGDRLDTSCIYRTTSKDTTTQFGDRRVDEMCIAAFLFYPAESITHDSCYTWNDLELCYVENGAIHGCEYAMLFNPADPVRKRLLSTVLDRCNYFGGCREECPDAIAEVKKHACFNDRVGPYVMDLLRGLHPDKETIQFLAAMHSCDCQATEQTTGADKPQTVTFIFSLIYCWMFRLVL